MVASRYFIKRNDNVYAYESVSERVPGKKNPITHKKYLGKVDPETGEIIPKQTKALPKSLITKEYGSALLLNHIQESLNLRDQLNESFDYLGDWILGIAMAQAIVPCEIMDSNGVLDNSFIPEFLGLNVGFEPQMISELVNHVGNDRFGIDLFFKLRMEDRTMYTFDLKSVSKRRHVFGWNEWGLNLDNELFRDLNACIVTNKDGLPSTFNLFPESYPYIDTLRHNFDYFRRYTPKGFRLIMEADSDRTDMIIPLLDRGIEFVMPADANAKPFKKLVTRSVSRMGESVRVHKGRAYKVVESSLGVTSDKGANVYLAEDDEGYENSPKITAFFCYDSLKAAEEEQRLMVEIDEIERELNGKMFRRPLIAFKEAAGNYEKFLDFSLDDDGAMVVERKRNAMAFAVNRIGTFILLATPGISWEDVMMSYDLRRRVENLFRDYKIDLDAERIRANDLVSARGQFLIKFIAMILRSRMEEVLRSSGMDNIMVDNALRSLGNLRVVGHQGGWSLTELTARNQLILEAFGIEAPRSVMTHPE